MPIKQIIIILLLNCCLVQTALAVPSNYRQYPASSPLITLVNPHELTVNYFHENFFISDPIPGPVILIDVSGDSTDDIKLETDLLSVGKTIYLTYEGLIKEMKIPESDAKLSLTQLTSINSLPITVCQYPGSSAAIKVNPLNIKDLIWYHEDIFISSPSQGPSFTLDLTGDDDPDIQIDCDTAAIGKTIYFVTNGKSTAYTIGESNDIPIPKGLRISHNAQQIELTWYYMGDELTYNVYKSNSENGFYIKCDPFELTEPKFIDTDIVEGTQYWYKIKAVNIKGEEGLFSDAVSTKIEPVEGGSFQLISHQPYQMQLSGLSATYDIQIKVKGNYSNDIQLNVVDLHSWMKASFDHAYIRWPNYFSRLTVDIPNTLPPDRYTFYVSAVGNNRDDKIPLFLDVKNPLSNDSAISAYIKTPHISLNQSIEIYGEILPRGINTLLNIQIQHESDDNPIIINAHTDNTNSYKIKYTPQKTGLYTIYSSWDGDNTFNPAQSPSLELTVFRGKSKLTCQTKDVDISPDAMVQVTGKLDLPRLDNAHIILKIQNPEGKLEWIKNRIYTKPDSTFNYSIKLEDQGIWEITSCWEGNDQYLGAVSFPLRLYPGLKAGKALIVAGGGLANNTLWPTIQYLTKEFYEILLKRHFTQQMIYYISPDINHQNDQIVINDNTPQVSDIENYIKSLYEGVSQPDVNPERPFLLYLADHGGRQAFKVNHGREILKAQDLDLWLDNLQTNTNCSVYVILEACFSGSFVDVLAPSSDQKRVILTSAGGNDQSLSNDKGLLSFSRFLFNELSTGNNLFQSFDNATAKMEKMYLFNKQSPQIFDAQDGELAKTCYIGGTFLIADILPEIVDHTPMQTLSAGSNELFVDISDVEGIDHAWVSIMPPHFHIPESTNDFETPIIDLPKLDLTDQGNGRYTGIYDDFTHNGVYYVTFHCEDIGGNVVSKEVLMNVIDGHIPGDLDNNGKITLCDAIISLQAFAGMTVSVPDNARILCNGVVGACEVIEILQVMAGMK